jgi:hypothetical protein
MPIVYVTQEQPGKNLTSALEFGEIRPLLPPTLQVGFSAGQVARELLFKLSRYTPEDYLLLIGDPVIIGISAAVAAHWSNGKVRLLKWDRQTGKYFPVEFNLRKEIKGNEEGSFRE